MRLTIRRLRAIQNALSAKTAGELEDWEDAKAYQGAEEWVAQELNRRNIRRKEPELV